MKTYEIYHISLLFSPFESKLTSKLSNTYNYMKNATYVLFSEYIQPYTYG